LGQIIFPTANAIESIEEQYLCPVLKTAKGKFEYFAKPDDYAFCCDTPIDELKGNTVYKQSGGTGFTDDKSTSKNIRLFPVMGGGILFLPNKKLFINLRKAQYFIGGRLKDAF
jgi:hypothetical protein